MELSAFKRNNFILNKLLPCLLITIFAIMCLYGSKVYAADSYSFPLSDGSTFETSTLPELEYDGLILIKAKPNYVTLINYPTTSRIVCSQSSGSKFFYLINSYGYTNTFTVYSKSSNTDTFSLSSNNMDKVVSHDEDFIGLYTNNDIHSTSSKGQPYVVNDEILFTQPPQTQSTIVASQVEEVEMNKTLQEILGILPVLIVVLVGLIAIRKGIQFLIARMKKA